MYVCMYVNRIVRSARRRNASTLAVDTEDVLYQANTESHMAEEHVDDAQGVKKLSCH